MRRTRSLAFCVLALAGVITGLGLAGVAQAAISESVAKNAALQMTATLENSTTELQFNYAENIGDGRGITFGAIGFCTGTYDGNELVKHYTELNPDNNLAKYIPALDAIDAGPHNSAGGDGNPSTTGLSGFIAAVESNTDPLFRQAQMDMLDELYWDPAVDMADGIGAEYNLTLAYIYDMSVRHGPDGAQEMIDEAIDEAGGAPGDGVNEKTFLSTLMSVRDGYLEDEGLGDVDRNDGFKQVLSSGNVNLNTPYSFTAYGDSFTIKAGVYTDTGTTTKYALTVNYGNGDGSYASGTSVTITANAPATGKVFDRWTGATSYLVSTTSATTTVTMPASAITLTATYKDIPKYTLTVNYGNGDGSYAQGSKVTITANAPASGKIFDKWTGSIAYVANTTSATTTLTMPANAITLTATYKDIPKYTLTVTNGSGDGSYASGAKPTITANAPATGKVFDKWTGDTSYLASTTSATTTVTMPAKAITLTATYKDIPKYTLTVTNGSGDGSYASGTSVTITANSPATGKVFDKWTGATSHLASTTSATTTVTMPATAITLTATYKDAPVTTYALTVNYGSGDGSYASGTSVTITANTPATGKVFDRWTGSTSYLASTTSATTTVTMPASAITLTATYKDIPKYALTVTNGSGDGSYASGTNVTITANAPTVGKLFDKWTGDIAYLTSVSSSSTTVAMPAKPITLTAVYKDITTYALTVTKGTGDGLYANGAKITIKADTAPSGQSFVKWTGDTAYLSSTTSPTAIVTMPNKAINLTATYTNSTTSVEKMYYLLIVNQGTGSEAYEPGTKVSIAANMTISELIFDKWTGDTQYLADINDPTTTVTMPSKHISVTATFKSSPLLEKYLLTVNQGTGDGEYEEGDKVTITADNPASGKVFDKWTGAVSYLASASSASTTVTMPAKPITLTAVYKDASSGTYTLTVNQGTGSGEYEEGEEVLIRALSQTGKLFDKWTGDIGYVSDPASLFAKVIMPAKPITLTAVYEAAGSGTINLPDGTLIKLPDSPKVYVIINGEKKWISTPEQFEQLGYQWQEIETVTEEILDAIEDIEDNLIRLLNDYKVYLVTNGVKRHIPNPDIFLDYGFSWDDVKDVDATTVTKYKDTYLIRTSGEEDVYFLNSNGVRKLIPTEKIFNSYGDRWEDVQIISKTEMESYPLSSLIQLQGTNQVYLISANAKKLIPDAATFNRKGYDWNQVILVNKTEFDYYQDGGTVK